MLLNKIKYKTNFKEELIHLKPNKNRCLQEINSFLLKNFVIPLFKLYISSLEKDYIK